MSGLLEGIGGINVGVEWHTRRHRLADVEQAGLEQRAGLVVLLGACVEGDQIGVSGRLVVETHLRILQHLLVSSSGLVAFASRLQVQTIDVAGWCAIGGRGQGEASITIHFTADLGQQSAVGSGVGQASGLVVVGTSGGKIAEQGLQASAISV